MFQEKLSSQFCEIKRTKTSWNSLLVKIQGVRQFLWNFFENTGKKLFSLIFFVAVCKSVVWNIVSLTFFK